MLPPAAQEPGTPEEILDRLLAGEIQRRADRALERRLQAARFPLVKTRDDFDGSWPQKINRAQIQPLFPLDGLAQHGHGFFLGGGGLGKSHLALALAYRAGHQGYSVRWVTAIDRVNTLLAAQHTHRLPLELKTFLKPQRLVLDERGDMPSDKAGADRLFPVIRERDERAAIGLTTNPSFKPGATIFKHDATMASALLDRLLHHGEPVVIEGKSYRMKDRIEPE